MMALTGQSTIRLAFSRLVSASVCLCAFVLLQVPQVATLASTETECPCQEDEKKSESELVVWTSAHRRASGRRRGSLSRPPETSNQHRQNASAALRFPTIVGHRLANGLRAPLVI